MILLILVLSINILWYWIKTILLANDYKVNWFWGHFNDIINIFRLAKVTQEPEKQKKYYLLGIAVCFGLLAFVLILMSHLYYVG
jgi:hypothetical protein